MLGMLSAKSRLRESLEVKGRGMRKIGGTRGIKGTQRTCHIFKIQQDSAITCRVSPLSDKTGFYKRCHYYENQGSGYLWEQETWLRRGSGAGLPAADHVPSLRLAGGGDRGAYLGTRCELCISFV